MTFDLPHTLTKGANVRMRDLGVELADLTVQLTVPDHESGIVDLDVSLLLLQPSGLVRDSGDFVFYNQPVGADGAVHLRETLRDDEHKASVSSISLNLDLLPTEVDRVLVAGSLDPATGLEFADLEPVRATVQDSGMAQDVLRFTVEPDGGERALVFGEFYLREGAWRFRAVAQGYAGGLEELITAHGVDVTDDAADGDEEVEDAGGSPSDPEPPASVALAENAAVSVVRSRRPPQLPKDWDYSIPDVSSSDYQPARLFPVVGIGSKDEQERRATSTLLALLPLVREFGAALTKPLGAPSGPIEAFVEVPFGHGGETYRPDGLLRVKRGAKVWQALVEVKTSGARLTNEQVSVYVDIAKSQGFDAVLTISNHLADPGLEHPAGVDGRKLKKIQLHHLSWAQITTVATTVLAAQALDPTKSLVLNEFIRYAEHERSGLHGFLDMGSKWPMVRDAVKAKTMRPQDKGAIEIVDRFDELMRQTAFNLTRALTCTVRAGAPSTPQDHATRLQQLSDSGLLYGTLSVPGALDAMVVCLDVRADSVSVHMTVPAPREGRPLTRVNWLLRHLTNAPKATVVEAGGSANQRSWTAEKLGPLQEDPRLLVPLDGQDIRHFTISHTASMGAKRAASSKAVPAMVDALVHEFYRDVVQHLRAPK